MTKPSAHWKAPDFTGRVALVTGASHGAGRGIAHVLGETGATVFVTARRIAPLRETAREVDARGGRGVAVKCDHRDDAQVQDLFARIVGDAGGLDILVNNVVGWGDVGGARQQPWGVPAWEQPLARRRDLPDDRDPCQAAKENWRRGGYDLPRLDADRWCRQIDEGDDCERCASPPTSRDPWTWESLIDETESQEFVGRAVAAMAGAPDRLRLSGRTFQTAALAERYMFKDIDGRMPN